MFCFCEAISFFYLGCSRDGWCWRSNLKNLWISKFQQVIMLKETETVLHALWHACTLEPYRTLDPSLVSHTFDLLVSIVLCVVVLAAWLAAWCWWIGVNFAPVQGQCYPMRYITGDGDLSHACIDSGLVTHRVHASKAGAQHLFCASFHWI